MTPTMSIRPERGRTRPVRLAAALAVATAGAGFLAAQPAPVDSLERMLAGAHAQVGVTLGYDGAYRRIPYPGGDVPVDRGVCTDVIVRAYRNAGVDLQVAVHEDMVRAFAAYPRLWGATKPDANIDHRRVPNLATFLRRHGAALPPSTRAADYVPGDIVTWRLASGASHIGLVSDRRAGERFLVVHNVGEGARIEDVLFEYRVTGHYRYPASARQ